MSRRTSRRGDGEPQQDPNPIDTALRGMATDAPRHAIADEVRFLLAHDLAQAKEYIRWWACWRGEGDLSNYVRRVKRLGRENSVAR